MSKHIKGQVEVGLFLEKVRALTYQEESIVINNLPWKGKVNKTRRYMDETGIKKKDILEVIRELSVENYSSTQDDINNYFKGEQVWMFGITKNLVDCDEKIYIKLKIRKIGNEQLLIMSFHPEEPKNKNDKLDFPYKNKK